MRRRLVLSLGWVGTGLATGAAVAGCGADAAGLCDFNVCTPQSIVGLNDGSAPQDATMGGEGSVNGPETGSMDGGVDEGGGETGSETGPLPDGSCGNPSLTYCGPGAGCVDTTGSAANCGMCGNQCPTPMNATATCDASSCGFACDSTHFLCDGGCDSTSAPPSDTCVLNETFGVFVAPTGVDALGNGTRAAPYASIGYAIQNPKGAARVYVCAGTYDETISVGAGTSALTIYGGFSCATPTTWAWTSTPIGTEPVVKVQPTAGVPLTIAGTSTALTFADLEFDAPNATSEGQSSIASIVSGASGVVGFVRSTFTAGTGAAGANGVTPATALPVATTGNGPDATSNSGGAPVQCMCPFGATSIGGSGGTGGISPTDGSSGGPGSGVDKGTGGTAAMGCTNAAKGADATSSPGDGPGATVVASVSGTTWTPGPGQVGAGGETGQGGGGGGGGYAAVGLGNGGGGGGCGGCGGGGGSPGEGGGSSLGALVVGSTSVTFTTCVIQTAAGGNGGNGAAGQNGAGGGGKGVSSGGLTDGCNGGAGGAGGKGGAGGGGAGGSSAGIAWKGTAPSLDAVTQAHVTIGAAGKKGNGGNSPSNDGVPGAAQVVFPVP